MVLMLRTRDPLVEGRVERVAARLGLETLEAVHPAASGAPAEPAGLLVELGLEGSTELVRAWREASSELPIVAYLVSPEPELWSAAEQAGADEVTTRGLADRKLAQLVQDHLSGERRARRIRIAPLKDFAGRLGYVGRLDETPAGPIAIYHLDRTLHAVSDVCPHAGASLCAGELEGDVITCPRHGSQFRVTDGERVRGPADVPLRRFRVVVEGSEVFVELDERDG